MEFGWINPSGGIIVVLILIPTIVYALKKQRREVIIKEAAHLPDSVFYLPL